MLARSLVCIHGKLPLVFLDVFPRNPLPDDFLDDESYPGPPMQTTKLLYHSCIPDQNLRIVATLRFQLVGDRKANMARRFRPLLTSGDVTMTEDRYAPDVVSFGQYPIFFPSPEIMHLNPSSLPPLTLAHHDDLTYQKDKHMSELNR
jgi:hypothetical protein